MEGIISSGYGHTGYLYKSSGSITGYLFAYNDGSFNNGTDVANIPVGFRPRHDVTIVCGSASTRGGTLIQSSFVSIATDGKLTIHTLAGETIRDFAVSFTYPL